MPDKRYATKAGPGFLMQITVRSAYRKFKKAHDIKIGLSKFMDLRPKNVRKLSLKHRQFCLCPYCLNIKYKIIAINKAVVENNLPIDMKVEDEHAFLDVLLCKKAKGKKFHRRECVFGKCDTCKDVHSQIMAHYEEFLTLDKEVSWNYWGRSECEDGKIRRIMMTYKKTPADLVNDLVQDVVRPMQGITIMEHMFVAAWQSEQFQELKNNLPTGWVLLLMDFAKNRTVHYQDEIKSAFFWAKTNNTSSYSDIFPTR